jgi:hypothetical protein
MALAGLKLLSEIDEPLELPEYAQPPLSFKVGQMIADLHFRQTLLSIRSESERLKHIAGFLPDYLARMKRAAHIRKIAPTNGHGLPSLKDAD